jgi:hypothetical protein
MLQATPAPSTDRVPANQSAEQISKSQLWQERIANYERSALSIAEYCRSIECSVASFYQWRRKLRQSTPKSAFLSVQTSTLEVGNIEVRLPNGISIVISLQAIDSLPMILERVA